jgi:outer membrane immunogenic protein
MVMRHRFSTGIAVFAAAAFAAGAAGAADLAVKEPVYKAPPPAVSGWGGFYIGAHGGFAWDSTSVSVPALPQSLQQDNAQLVNLDAHPRGGIFGGQAGYNWQFGSIVTGVEGDYSAANLSTSGPSGTYSFIWCNPFCNPAQGALTRSVKFDELASGRVRLGYTVLPDLLAYGTAGVGWSHSAFGGTASDISLPGGTLAVATGARKFGWVAGTGLEYKLWNHVLVRAEYLHYDFGDITYNLPMFGVINTSSTVDVVRGGLSYKF